ncbi:hypothetical protein PSM7751_02179 [Pseudooceanicola marinus]|uniref:Outer membrane protein beta-barrel domain-containing protein n=1 Tax=Pseudooceanicola marinus TaxID=396013 RepID=A0A1X6ZBV9_9RHOB|nr:outer membrane beta-barrel protein [Pseudooceanicola marinus]SLN46761.1 hypothetical protein PSM7751_02179 [Pseudooceanicola marinus]
MITRNKTLRHFTAAALTGLCLAGSANADDWAGPFASIGLGSSHSRLDWTAGGVPIFAPTGYEDHGTADSLAISGEVGQMYRRGDFLLGWSVGLTSLDHEERKASPFSPGETLATEIGPMASLAGRVGKDYGNWLFYGEAGVAIAKLSVPNEAPYCPTPCRVSLDGMSTGFLTGIGADYRITDRYAVGINYRYVDFQARTASGEISGLGAPQEYEIGADASVITLRLTIALD